VRPSLLLSLFAPAEGGAGPGLIVFLFQMVAIMAIFYFLIIRPKVQQERKHKERLAQLKRGDEVITAGGIVGEVIHLKDDRVTVKSGESRLIVQRDRIAEITASKKAEAGSEGA
jgi:preprotein translocase subunit YajC